MRLLRRCENNALGVKISYTVPGEVLIQQAFRYFCSNIEHNIVINMGTLNPEWLGLGHYMDIKAFIQHELTQSKQVIDGDGKCWKFHGRMACLVYSRLNVLFTDLYSAYSERPPCFIRRPLTADVLVTLNDAKIRY